MEKSRISFMRLIALLVGFSILMTSCSLSKRGADLDSIDKDNQGKLICLFFPPNNTNYLNKTITLEFFKNISNYKLKKVKLFQNHRAVSGEIQIKDGDVIWNKVTIGLTEFVPEFNRAEFTLAEGKTMILNVGQYYLEKLDYKENVLKDNESYHLNNCTTHEHANRILSEYDFSIGNLSKLNVKIPNKILELGYSQNLVEKYRNKSMVSYKYSGEIPLNYFKQNKITTISYEAIFLQDTLDKGIKNFVFQDSFTLEAR